MTLAGLIAQAYPSPEWAVFYEVSNTTGFGASRRADAVALGIWPSRGNTLVGFEFKNDRRDWLREQKHPEKADVVASHCDAWYLVVSREDIAAVEEVPEPWGLLVANKDATKLITKKQCQWFPDRDKTIMRRSFVASMLRKFTETTVPKVEVTRLVEEAVEIELARTREGHELKHLKDEVASHLKIFDTFKTATGIDLLREQWRGPARIADAVNAVMHGGTYRQELERTANRLEITAKELRDGLKAWPDVFAEAE